MGDWRDESWDFLSGDLERDRRNLHLLMDTAEELYGVIDPEERMRRAVDRAVVVTGAEKGILLGPDGGVLKPRVARDASGQDLSLDLRYSRSCVREVWETGKPVLERGTTREVRPTASVIDEKLISIMAMRLAFEGRPVGVLYVHATLEPKTFTDADHQAFLALGGLIATAIMNARLAGESTERARLSRQVERARQVQRRLQPDGVETPVGYDIAGVGRVCQELSGDYYDVVKRPDGRIALAIGDVCGHGIRAALYGATARALFRRLMSEDCPPDRAIDDMSCFLEEDMEVGEFMSFFLGVLDPEARHLVWASAGHDPPLVRRAPGEIVELKGTGKPLGFMSEEPHGLEEPIPFGAGHVMLLYTDGLTLARRAPADIWGEARLRDSLDRHAGADLDAQGVLAAVMADVDAWRKPGPLDDDITCVVVRGL